MRDWLDDNLNERMQELGNNLDLDAAWADLEVKRSQQSKRRSPLFWWMLLGGFSTGLVAGEWQSHAAPDAITIEQEQAIPTVPEMPIANNTIGTYRTETTRSKTPAAPTADLSQSSQTANRKTVAKSRISNSQNFDKQHATLQNSSLNCLTVPLPRIPINPTLNRAEASVAKPLDLVPLVKVLPSHSPNFLSSADQLEKAHAPRPRKMSPWSVIMLGQYGLLSQSGLAAADPVDIFGGGIQARYTIKPWLWLESGLAFQQYNSQITYDQELVEFQTLENQVIAYVEYANGTIEEFRGETIATVTTLESFTGWQKHRILSIPVQVGIGLPLPSRSQVGIYLGGSYGILANHGGYGVNSVNAERVLLNDLAIRKTNLFQWQASLFAEQSFGKHWSVQIALGRQQALGDWGLGLSPRSWHGQLGVVRKLSK
ncbi:MAG: hypothetical protein AAGH79_08870 [Bacteroidota bacterium]